MTDRENARSNRWAAEAKAFAWLLGGDSATRLASQIAVVFTARLLGPEEYGALAAALAAFSLVVVLSDLGLGDSSVQHLTRREDNATVFWHEVAPIRLALSIPLVPCGLALASFSSNASMRATGLLVAAVPMASILTARVFAARIVENFGAAAGWNALLSLSQAVGALLAAIAFARTGVAAAAGIAAVLVIAASGAARKRRWHMTPHTVVREWLRRALPFGIAAGGIAIYSRVDRLVLAAITGSDAAGGYVAAYNIVMVAGIAGAALHVAVLPRLLDDERRGTASTLRRPIAAITCLAVPLAVFLIVFSDQIMTMLYGPSFASSSSVLRVLSPLVLLYVLNPLLASSLVAAGKQRALARIAVVNAVFAVAAYSVLTLWFGAVGTAAGSVGVECLSLILVIRARSRDSGELSSVARALGFSSAATGRLPE